MRIGGVERALIGLLEQLLQEGHRVDLFLWAHDGDFMPLLPAGINLLPEIPAYARLERPIVRALADGFWGIALARLGAKLATALRARVLGIRGFLLPRSLAYALPFLPPIPGTYDAAFSFLAPHHVALHRAKATWRVAWIHTDYGSVETGVDHAFEVKTWSCFDLLVAVSGAVQDAFLRTFPSLAGKVMVLENLLSPAAIQRQAELGVPADMPNEPGVFKICSVGRFSHAKNFDSIPEVCLSLINMGVPVRWYLIGYGMDEGLIQQRIREFGMGQVVVVLGRRSNPYPYIRNCDLYAQPSRYEGKAVAVTEAQILGKPVLVTNYPTACDQVTHAVDGWICGPAPEQIAEGIRVLAGDSALRTSLARNAAESLAQTDRGPISARLIPETLINA